MGGNASGACLFVTDRWWVVGHNNRWAAITIGIACFGSARPALCGLADFLKADEHR
jgi:hypothetical protein